ncbi:MAG: NUDIX hydrolase [Ruminococcus sp.]|nr:NUDIX hydrolase [Ruminococcus sp.]
MASSEETFLSEYRLEDYDRPSVAADIALFTIRSEEENSYRHEPENHLSLLLIQRGEHPFQGAWALPGGFMRADETIEACAYREITTETNVTPSALMSVGVFSEPDRDPRGRIISNAFLSIIGEENVQAAGGDDAADARWFKVQFEEGVERSILTLKETDITIEAVLRKKHSRFGRTEYEILESGGLAFDHAKMIAAALALLRQNAKDFELIFDFLPERFTLTELQKVQETIMNISVLPANFRRKIAGYVTETDEYTKGAGHRPAKLFRRK